MDPMQNHANPQDEQGSLPAPNPAAVPPTDSTLPLGLPVQPPLTQQQGVSSYSTDSPTIADDVDLIEKEWVVKAKDIVARTKDDPNAQSKDMNRFKADYLKTRYNKDVKVNEA